MTRSYLLAVPHDSDAVKNVYQYGIFLTHHFLKYGRKKQRNDVHWPIQGAVEDLTYSYPQQSGYYEEDTD